MTNDRQSRQRRQAGGRTLTDDAREVAATCAGMAARAVARRTTRFFEARMAETGLSFAQFSLMVLIAAAVDDTIGALAERADLDQSTLSRNLRGLERAGLVEITVVEKDLRRRAVWLTEAGALKLEAAIPAWRQAQAELAGLLDPAARRAAAALATASSATAPRSDRNPPAGQA